MKNNLEELFRLNYYKRYVIDRYNFQTRDDLGS